MSWGRSLLSTPAWLLVAAALGLVVLVIVALGFALLTPVSTTFNLTATTERVSFERDEPDSARWILDHADLYEDATELSGVSGSIEIAAPVSGFVQRIGLGPLWAHLECQGPCTSVGRLFDQQQDPVRALGPRLDIFIDDLDARAAEGRTVIFQLAGDVVSGRSVGIEVGDTTAVLREGTVSLLDRSIFGNNVFEAGRITLSTGDKFLVADRDPRSSALGFVLADERPALTAAYRVVGSRASVVRPGGGSYDVSAPLLGRLFHDELFRAFSAVLAAFATFSTIAALIVALADAGLVVRRRHAARGAEPPLPEPAATESAADRSEGGS